MRRLWVALLFLVVLVALGGTAAAVPITVPTGLNFGDQYRLAFVTSTKRDATSANIADYNAFVTAAANAVPVLAALGTTWRVIGSTLTVDARDNTNTNLLVDGVGVPIYLLDGTQLASGNADLWDGSIAVDFNIDENGLGAGAFVVWTGTGGDGVGDGIHPLGSELAFTIFGAPTLTTAAQWIALESTENTAGAPYYATSAPLTVIPEPSTALLLASGLVALAVRRRSHVR